MATHNKKYKSNLTKTINIYYISMLENWMFHSSHISGWEKLAEADVISTIKIAQRLVEKNMPFLLIASEDQKSYTIHIPSAEEISDTSLSSYGEVDMSISNLGSLLMDHLTKNSATFFCVRPYGETWKDFLLCYLIRDSRAPVAQKSMTHYAWIVSHTLQ